MIINHLTKDLPFKIWILLLMMNVKYYIYFRIDD